MLSTVKNAVMMVELKKQTNVAMEDFGKCYIYLLVIFYNYKIQKQ